MPETEWNHQYRFDSKLGTLPSIYIYQRKQIDVRVHCFETQPHRLVCVCVFMYVYFLSTDMYHWIHIFTQAG